MGSLRSVLDHGPLTVAQVIGIGGRMHTEDGVLAIVDAFLTTPWSEAPRHQRRIDILADYERTHVPPPVPGAPD